MIKSSILFNSKKYPVEFFRDDTIEVVQQQISRSLDIHPDRLYILVGLNLTPNYYSRDPRNWEKLFQRLSLDGKNILPETFETYSKDLRIPAISEPFEKYDREEWMQSSPKFKKPEGNFIEYRILGVEAVKSYCLPLDFSEVSLKIPAAQLPIPELQKLFLSFYGDLDIHGFRVLEHESFEGPYFPLLRSVSPQKLTEAQIKSLEANSEHLKDLMTLDYPKHERIIILKGSWRIDLVDTNFGDAVRTRFEQIFYGLSMSSEIPVITFQTSPSEVSRHKFFKELDKSEPLIDVAMWKNWLTKTKPSREIPTLVLFRGDSRDSFDRIAISPIDILFTSYRNEKNIDDLNTLQQNLLKWFKTFDSVIPFIQESDYALCRLELQEVKFEAVFAKSILKFDTSRLNCLTGIFEESSKNKSLFRFLRSDHTQDDLNPRDLKIINLLKENLQIKAEDVEKELKVSLYEAQNLLSTIKKKIEEEPELLTKEHSKFPRVEIREDSILVAYVNEIDRYLNYSSMLRFILSNPNSPKVNKICPKKIEVSDSTFSIEGEREDIEFSDLFDFLEKEPEKKTEVQKDIKPSSGYSYFYDRMKKKVKLPQNYPKKCEKQHQPTLFSDEDLAELSGTPYDPQNYSEDLKLNLEIEDFKGLAICPEYWCMTDEIPLQKSQLEEFEGNLVCPVCRGKIRSKKEEDIVEFSVIERKAGYVHPGFPKGEEKNIPCCFTTPKQKKVLEKNEELGKYYIMNEEKAVKSLRLAYINKQILKSLMINEKYELAKSSVNRIQSGMSGFFRVGIERSSIDLPKLMRITKDIVSPRFAVESILRCAFLATWSKLSDTYSKEIEKELVMKPFAENNFARKKIAQIISSISEEFEKGTLNQIYELEYSAIVLKTDLFKIDLATKTFSCSFFSTQNKLRSRGIIILQLGEHIDCLSYVSRTGQKLKFKSNIFEEPFTEKTIEELFILRREACIITEFPTFDVITGFLIKKEITDYSIILDPFGRGQAFYSPGKFILPFKTTNIPKIDRPTLNGYCEIDVLTLPTYQDTLEFIKGFDKYYVYSEDIHDSQGNVVEIVTTSGLRIPVRPFKKEGQNSEIYGTLKEQNEFELTFGEASKEDLQAYKKISYNSEIHEFLIFQLSKDLDEYPELKYVLSESPKSKKVEILLYSWFEHTTEFMSIKKPIEFLSKIRKPCGQLKKDTCNSGHMCAWSENKCKIQIRDEFSQQKVFQKLLGTLMENSKIRALVLDGRVTPFFSTILYLELPNELMITDREIKQFTQGEP
jgi:hypothetical protein